MKQSKYNFFFPLPDGQNLAFNALKNGLAVLKGDIVEQIKAVQDGESPAITPDVLKELERGGFLCHDQYDEYGVLIIRKNMEEFSTSGFGLTILPVYRCNLTCAYCFEPPDPSVMKAPVTGQIIAYVKKQFQQGIQRFGVTWFGGEPLLALDVIEKLSSEFIDIAAQYKKPYSAYIITNGTLFNRAAAEKLKELKVSGAQITIDGEKETHDQRRPFKNGKGSFDIIMNNVRETVGIIPIGLRVNIDKTNVEKAVSFLDKLKDEEWFKANYGKMLSIHFGYVRNYTSSCRCSKDSNLEPLEYWRQRLGLYRKLKECGYGFKYYPELSFGCCATSINSYVVDPLGNLFKCWNHVGDPGCVVGNISKPIELNPFYITYLTESFEKCDECKECKFLPICMGGCVDVRVKAKKGEFAGHDCAGWKYYLEDALREFYLEKVRTNSK